MLTNTAEVLECRDCKRYSVDNVWSFLFSYFCKLAHTKFIASEARFHAKKIGASHVIIACKMAKLFKFLLGTSQHKCTCTIMTPCYLHVLEAYLHILSHAYLNQIAKYLLHLQNPSKQPMSFEQL